MKKELKELVELLGQNERQYEAAQPAPPRVAEVLVPFAALMAEYDALMGKVERMRNKLAVGRDDIIEAIHEHVPGAREREFKWDAKELTVSLAAQAADAQPPEWVRELLDDDGKPAKVTAH